MKTQNGRINMPFRYGILILLIPFGITSSQAEIIYTFNKKSFQTEDKQTLKKNIDKHFRSFQPYTPNSNTGISIFLNDLFNLTPVAAQKAAQEYVSELPYERRVQLLETLTKSSSESTRLNAARILHTLEKKDATPLYVSALSDRQSSVRANAVESLSDYLGNKFSERSDFLIELSKIDSTVKAGVGAVIRNLNRRQPEAIFELVKKDLKKLSTDGFQNYKQTIIPITVPELTSSQKAEIIKEYLNNPEAAHILSKIALKPAEQISATINSILKITKPSELDSTKIKDLFLSDPDIHALHYIEQMSQIIGNPDPRATDSVKAALTAQAQKYNPVFETKIQSQAVKNLKPLVKAINQAQGLSYANETLDRIRQLRKEMKEAKTTAEAIKMRKAVYQEAYSGLNHPSKKIMLGEFFKLLTDSADAEDQKLAQQLISGFAPVPAYKRLIMNLVKSKYPKVSELTKNEVIATPGLTQQQKDKILNPKSSTDEDLATLPVPSKKEGCRNFSLAQSRGPLALHYPQWGGTCAVESALDYINYHLFLKGKKVATSPATTLIAAMEASQSHELHTNEDPFEGPFEGNDFLEIVQNLQKKGLCNPPPNSRAADFVSGPGRREFFNEFYQYYLELNRLKRSQESGDLSKKAYQAVCHKIPTISKKFDDFIKDYKQTTHAEDYKDFMSAVINCKHEERIDVSSVPLPVRYPVQDDDSFEKHLDSYFDPSKPLFPLEISYCSSVLESPDRAHYRGVLKRGDKLKLSKDCESHSSLVIGQRCVDSPDRKSIKRQVLLRTHWGTCNDFPGLDCNNGNVWIDVNDLGRNVYKMSGIDHSRF